MTTAADPYRADMTLLSALLGKFKLHNGPRPVNFMVRAFDSADRTQMVHVAGAWYFLTDNGGEINVEAVNGEFLGSVPLCSFGRLINEATTAMRIAGNDPRRARQLRRRDDRRRTGALAQKLERHRGGGYRAVISADSLDLKMSSFSLPGQR